ncbi:MAG: outer membrane protein assembly factor BamD [Alphaproteobacteria bacterium]|nr:MAG: outer membrane protein assembly factor BamD [Alphaproteobacteria bacterium]
MRKLSLFLLPLFILTQCSDPEELHDDMPLRQLYEIGLKRFNNHSFEEAEKYFQAIEKQYPYTDYVKQAQLMSGLCAYMDNRYLEAIAHYKEFIALHPNDKSIPYALYMIGYCNYLRASYIERDQSMAKDAYLYFREITTRFPNSKYQKDAELKLQQMVDHISAKELHVARYYMREHLYHAALERLNRVSKDSIHHPEAYYRMMESYRGLSLNHEAELIKKKLLKEYPDTPFAKKLSSSS